DLDAGVVAGERPAGPFLLRLVVARQVGADRVPVHAVVGRAEQHLGAVIEHVLVMRRDRDRRGPLESVLAVFGAVAGHVVRIDRDVAILAGAFLPARDVAGIFAGIDEAGRGWIEHEIPGLAA